eukprot:354311-Chlamydomonas_euryale.AAC.5
MSARGWHRFPCVVDDPHDDHGGVASGMQPIDQPSKIPAGTAGMNSHAHKQHTCDDPSAANWASCLCSFSA